MRPVIACVAARMNSTRLARKTLIDVNGKPLLLRLVERLRMARRLDGIVLCTSTHPDDAVLLDFAGRNALEAIAGSEKDVLARFLEAANRYGADAVVRVTGDNVLTDPETVDRLVEHHLASGAEYTRINGLPLGAAPEVMSAAMLPRLHALMPDPEQSEYMMLYAFDPERFRCEVLEAPEPLRRPAYSLSVDTPADLEQVRAIYTACSPGGGEPALAAIIGFLDSAPDVRSIALDSPIRLPEGRKTTFGALLADLDARAARARARAGAQR